MRAQYDLRDGRRNPYPRRLGPKGREVLIEQYLRAEGLVRLDEDIAAAFDSEQAVNEALRLVLQLRELAPKPPKKTASATRAGRRRLAGGRR